MDGFDLLFRECGLNFLHLEGRIRGILDSVVVVDSLVHQRGGHARGRHHQLLLRPSHRRLLVHIYHGVVLIDHRLS